MPEDFLIARNPEEGTTLPYLLRIPLGPDGIVLKAKDTWPRTGKVYCHRAVGWPLEPEIVERVGTRSCVQRGPRRSGCLRAGPLLCRRPSLRARRRHTCSR